MTRLSVGICTHDRPVDLADCLAALAASLAASAAAARAEAAAELQVIAVDSASPAPSAALVERYRDRLLQFASITRWGDRPREPRSSAEWPFGANVAFRRAALSDAGAFAVELGRNGAGSLASGEDSDMVARVLAAGWAARALARGALALGALAVGGLALVLRARGLHRGLIYPDGYDYLLMACGIAAHLAPTVRLGPRGALFVPSVDAALEPLFPALVALLSGLWGGTRAAADAVTVAAGTATVVLAGALAVRLTGSRAVGVIAAAAALISPALAYWSGFMGPDPLAVALALILAVVLSGRAPAARGLVADEWPSPALGAAGVLWACRTGRGAAALALLAAALVLGATYTYRNPGSERHLAELLPLAAVAAALAAGRRSAAAAPAGARARARPQLVLAAAALAVGFLVARPIPAPRDRLLHRARRPLRPRARGQPGQRGARRLRRASARSGEAASAGRRARADPPRRRPAPLRSWPERARRGDRQVPGSARVRARGRDDRRHPPTCSCAAWSPRRPRPSSRLVEEALLEQARALFG